MAPATASATRVDLPDVEQDNRPVLSQTALQTAMKACAARLERQRENEIVAPDADP